MEEEKTSKKKILPKRFTPTIPVGQHPDDEFYNMAHSNRGIGLIFNHENFDSILFKERKGTQHDRNAMEGLLKKLGFHVEVYDDFDVGKIKETLRIVAKMDHSENDCLVIVVLSHGRNNGRVAAKDGEYTVDEMIGMFDGHHCPTLAGKPKLFFIQACRGDNLDSGVKIESDSSSKGGHVYKIPAMADILIMYATVEGYSAWRDQKSGSWFIQTLVKKLEENHDQRNLLSILTMVNREVAIGFESTNISRDYDSKKEMCSIVSMLTRELYFR